MPGLKLPKLPDRAPVKMAISLDPDLHKKLQAYADFYRDTYGEAESVPELIPYILRAFINSDRAFLRQYRP